MWKVSSCANPPDEAPWLGAETPQGVAEANQSAQKIMTTSVTITPTWEFAVQVYCEVLQNPEASHESLCSAREELLRLARIVDNLKSKQSNQ